MTPAVKPPKATVVDLLMRAAERLMLAAQDEGAVLRGAIDLLGDRFGYEMRYVLLWRPERKVLEMAVVGGPAADRPEVRAFTTRLGVGLTGRCAESLATVYAPDVSKDPRYVGLVGECASELCVPIAVGDTLLGVLALESGGLDAFTHEDEIAVEAFSKLLALALTNARANDRIHKDIEVLEALNDVAEQAASLDLGQTLDAAVRAFQRLTASDSTAIHLYRGERRELEVGALVFDPSLYPADYEETVRSRGLALGEGFVGWAAQHRQPAVIDDDSKDPRRESPAGFAPEVKSALAFPLIVEDRLVGVINAVKMGVGRYRPEHVRLAQTLAHQSALAIAAAQAYAEIAHLSLTDELTGLANARALKARLDAEIVRAVRYKRPLSLLLIDSDALKRVNDKFGHDAGDHLLLEVAAGLRRELRATDFVGRYGGDEFIALVPETDLGAAAQIARRLLSLLATPDEAGRLCTVSIGVAAVEPGILTGEQLFRVADRALYQAKRLGKNRAEVSSLIEAS